MYLPPAMERAGCFLSYKQPHRFVLRLFLGKKSSESFLASALYRSGAAFVRDAYLKRTRSLCATQPLPGKVADKLEWGWIRNPWLWVPKAIRAMLSCYSGTGERRFHRTGLTESNHLIHRKLPPPSPTNFLFCLWFLLPSLWVTWNSSVSKLREGSLLLLTNTAAQFPRPTQVCQSI